MTDKNCTFCHWYNWETKGCACTNTFDVEKENIQALIENAPVRETVEEGFFNMSFNRLQRNLESKLSKKQAKRIMEEFYAELEDLKLDWIDEITDQIICLVAGRCEQKVFVKIKTPKDFHCKHFM